MSTVCGRLGAAGRAELIQRYRQGKKPLQSSDLLLHDVLKFLERGLLAPSGLYHQMEYRNRLLFETDFPQNPTLDKFHCQITRTFAKLLDKFWQNFLSFSFKQ